MSFDSLIRLRQLNKPEASGYVVDIIKQYLLTGTGISVSSTGTLTGVFYPRSSNPSGYATGSVVLTSQTGNLIDTTALAVATNSLLTQSSGLFYSINNPSGYMTRASGDRLYFQFGPTTNTGQLILEDNVNVGYSFDFNPNKWFFIRGTGSAEINLYTTTGAYVSGFDIYSDDIKLSGKNVLNDTGLFVNTNTGAVNTRLYLRDVVKGINPFGYLQGTEYILSGVNNAVIDLYDSRRSYSTPYISGFVIDAPAIKINGVSIYTGGGGSGISLAELQSASGVLNSKIDVTNSNLANLALRVGPPSGRPLTFYLTNNYVNYSGKGLTAFSTIQQVFNAVVASGSGLYRVYVGTGDFGTANISGTGSNARLKLGEITFYNEFNSSSYSPSFVATLKYCDGRIRFNDSFFSSTLYAYSGLMSFDCDEYLPDDLNPLFIYAQTITGSINRFSASISVEGQSDITVNECRSLDFSVGMFVTGVQNLTVNNSIITAIHTGQAWSPSWNVRNSIINGRHIFNNAVDGNFISFSGAPVVAPPLYSMPQGWGAISYAPSGLYLFQNKSGVISGPDLLLTKNSGDFLYYSSSNPSSYTTANYVAATYASLTSAALLNDTTHNSEFLLADSTNTSNPLKYSSASQDFVVKNKSGTSVINVYGKGSGSGIPYISGFNIHSNNIYVSGQPLNVALNAVTTGNFISMVDDLHNTRLGLWHTGTNVYAFYLSGGNEPYYLQNYYRASNGAISYLNKIDLQNSNIDGFSYSNIKGFTQKEGSFNLVNDSLGVSVFNYSSATNYFVAQNESQTAMIDFMGSNIGTGKATMSGFFIDATNVRITGALWVSGVRITGNGVAGNFYPGDSNPSGYITTGQTGNFADASKTGIFITTGQTGLFAQSALTGVFITTGQTGQFAPSGLTGNFITTGQTGVFYPRSNPSGFVTSAQTGALQNSFISYAETGAFYPRSGNISGFVKNFDLVSPNTFISPTLYLPELGNVLYKAGERCSVTTSGFASFTNSFVFDGDYESFAATLTSGTTGIITIDLSGFDINTIVYPGGNIYVSFYFQNIPTFVTGRSRHVGDVWHDFANTVNISTVSNLATWKLPLNPNFTNLNLIEITVIANTGVNAVITEIDYMVDRRIKATTPSPLVEKDRDSETYGNLSFNDTGRNSQIVINRTGSITVGNTTSGTYKGNTQLLSQDQFPTLAFRSGTTVRSSISTDLSADDLRFNSFHDFIWRQFTASDLMRLSSTGGLRISGIPVILASQTGLFYSSGNPSGYIRKADYAVYDTGLVKSIDWSGRDLIDSFGATTVDWEHEYLVDSVGAQVLNWSGHTMSTVNGLALNWETLILTGGAWKAPDLLVSGSNVVTRSQTGQFYASSNPSGYVTTGQTGVFARGDQVVYLTGNQTISGTKTFKSTIFVPQLFGDVTTNGVDLNNGQLSDFFPSISVDWVNRTLTGGPAWRASDLLISGSNVVTKALTGALQNSFVSYAETGAFYPKTGNPSGYIMSSQTGAFAASGLTGNFIVLNEPRDVGFSGNFTVSDNKIFISKSQRQNMKDNTFPAYYYPNVMYHRQVSLTTGAWAINTCLPRLNNCYFSFRVHGYGRVSSQLFDFTVAGMIRSVSLGNIDGQSGAATNYSIQDDGNDGLEKWVGINSGGFLALGFANTGNVSNEVRFSVDAWVTDFTTFVDISTGWTVTRETGANFGWLDISQLSGLENHLHSVNNILGTGAFYPKTGNPSGYILPSQTGSFITTNQTGLFAPAALTGSFITTSLTGQFYPRSGNPSGFLVTNMIYQSGTSLGFNTTTPDKKFHFAGDALIDNSTFYVGATGTVGSSAFGFQVPAHGNTFGEAFVHAQQSCVALGANPQGTPQLSSFAGGTILFPAQASALISNNTKFFVTNNNASITLSGAFIGIGTYTGIAPRGTLDVSGNMFASSLTISGSPVVISSQTGNFADASQVVYITGNQTISGTKTFKSTIFTPQLYGDITTNGVSLNNGQLTDFFPTITLDWVNRSLTGGAWGAADLIVSGSSVVTRSQTGLFAPAALTGNFVTTTQTGALTGVFYPMTGNPSGFVTTSQTGSFVISAQTGNFVTKDSNGNVSITGMVSGKNIVSSKKGFGAGIYTFSKLVSGSSTGSVFSIGSITGSQVMTVMVNVAQSGYSNSKLYAVSHNYGTSPSVNLLSASTPSGSNDYSSIFADSFLTGVRMDIKNNAAISANFYVTVILGATANQPIIDEY